MQILSEILHIYTRVSTVAQEEDGTSLETQREQGIRKSDELGFDHKVWNEGGQSSFKDDLVNRPVLVDLLSVVEEGRVKHLFVFNTDRLSRNDQTWNLIRLKLVQHEVTLYTPDGVYLLSDPMNKMLLGILSEISSYDNSLRSERSRLGKLKRVKQGGWLGGPPPFGYRLENKRLVENPDESKWVKFIFESYRDKKTARWIKQELLKNGVMTRRKKPVWSLGSIEKLLTNTHYSGYYWFNDKKSQEKVRVECPSIIPFTLYENVQKERESRTHQTRVSESNQKNFYLLRDFLKCGQCGSRYSGRYYTKQYRSVYYCPRKERNYVNEDTEKIKKCDNRRYLKIEETDKLVWDTVVQVLSNSHIFKEEIKSQVLGTSATYGEQKENIKKLNRKLRAIETQISDCTASIVDLETNKILQKRNASELERIIENVETERIRLESEREKLKDEIHGVKTQNQWIDWVTQFGDRINQMSEFTTEDKHAFLRGVLNQIIVKTLDKQTHELLIQFKFPYINDTLLWKDKGNKSLGHSIEDGLSELSVEIDSGKKSPNIGGQ